MSVAKKTAAQAPTFCPGIETLALALYEQAAREGKVPCITGRGRGRPRVEGKLAAWVAAMVNEKGVSVEKTAKLLEKMVPARVRGSGAEARLKRARRYLDLDKAHRVEMLRPGAADEAYRLPEERLARLERLIEHYVSLAYEQWLRVEKTLND